MMGHILSGFYCPLLRQRTMISISSSLQKTSLCTWTENEQITATAITLKCRLCLSCTIDPSKFTSAQVSVGFSHLLLCFRTCVCVCVRACVCLEFLSALMTLILGVFSIFRSNKYISQFVPNGQRADTVELSSQRTLQLCCWPVQGDHRRRSWITRFTTRGKNNTSNDFGDAADDTPTANANTNNTNNTNIVTNFNNEDALLQL